MKKLYTLTALLLVVFVISGAAFFWMPAGYVISGFVTPSVPYFYDEYDVQPIDDTSARVVAERSGLCDSYDLQVIVEVYDTVTYQNRSIVNWTLDPSVWYIKFHDFNVDHNDIIEMGAYIIQREFPPNCPSGSGAGFAGVDGL